MIQAGLLSHTVLLYLHCSRAKAVVTAHIVCVCVCVVDEKKLLIALIEYFTGAPSPNYVLYNTRDRFINILYTSCSNFLGMFCALELHHRRRSCSATFVPPHRLILILMHECRWESRAITATSKHQATLTITSSSQELLLHFYDLFCKAFFFYTYNLSIMRVNTRITRSR